MKTLYLLLCVAYASCFYIDNKAVQKEKIVGGENVEIKYVPYQALLLQNRNLLCGGTIIAKSWILTAAHCMRHEGVNEYNLIVRIGSSNLQKKGSEHKVEEIIVHEEYNPRNYDNDIALIKLQKPIKFSSAQKAIALVTPNEIPQTDEIVVLSGFGTTGVGMGASQFLKMTRVPVIDQKQCEWDYRAAPITDNMFCAGNGKSDTCQGDSGGPAVINNKLAGVVSSGFECASEQYPGVYMRVHKYYNWIMENTNDLH